MVRRCVEAIEYRVGMMRHMTSNVKVDVEIRKLLLDIGFFRSREPNYTKIVDLYWYTKELLAC